MLYICCVRKCEILQLNNLIESPIISNYTIYTYIRCYDNGQKGFYDLKLLRYWMNRYRL